MRPRRLLPLFLALLALLSTAPAVAAGPVEDGDPGVNGCGMTPVTWDFCDAALCVHVWWYEHNRDESACLPGKVQCFLFCVPCGTGLCGAPATSSCASLYRPEHRCEGELACAQAGHEPHVPARRACVPDLLP